MGRRLLMMFVGRLPQARVADDVSCSAQAVKEAVPAAAFVELGQMAAEVGGCLFVSCCSLAPLHPPPARTQTHTHPPTTTPFVLSCLFLFICFILALLLLLLRGWQRLAG